MHPTVALPLALQDEASTKSTCRWKGVKDSIPVPHTTGNMCLIGRVEETRFWWIGLSELRWFPAEVSGLRPLLTKFSCGELLRFILAGRTALGRVASRG